MEARPKTAPEIAKLPSRPDVLDAAKERGITNVVHFTMTNNVIGILASGVVQSRERVQEDECVEQVYLPNAKSRRRDKEWLDYVNLSIQRTNSWMFGVSSENWHPEVSWVALSFSPEILSHPGVVFTTTNNIYTGCRRAEGVDGFSAMFSDRILRWRDNNKGDEIVERSTPDRSLTTDRQAEVLYPGKLSIEYLQRIYVQTEREFDTVHGIMGGLNMDFPIHHAPEVFR